MSKPQRVYFGGPYYLPDLTENETLAFSKNQMDKVRKSAHVQRMEQLIVSSHSTAPTEIDGAVLLCEEEESNGYFQSFIYITEDESNDVVIKSVIFLGGIPEMDTVARIVSMNKSQLLKERFSRVPPRSILK